jgi:hypothetical protein
MWNRSKKCKVTVKAYQEIDNLTRPRPNRLRQLTMRSDLPDPADILEQQMKAQQAQMEQLLHGRIVRARRRCIIKRNEKSVQ